MSDTKHLSELTEADQQTVMGLVAQFKAAKIAEDEAKGVQAAVRSAMREVLDRLGVGGVECEDGAWGRFHSTSGGKLDRNILKSCLLRWVPPEDLAAAFDEATSAKVTEEVDPVWRKAKGTAE